MAISMQILFGFVIGWTGLLRIAESPAPGISALILAGVLILRGIDQLWRVNEQTVDK